jgi:hypothetical protein
MMGTLVASSESVRDAARQVANAADDVSTYTVATVVLAKGQLINLVQDHDGPGEQWGISAAAKMGDRDFGELAAAIDGGEVISRSNIAGPRPRSGSTRPN